MAKYRPIKTSFWEDSWIAQLSINEKLLYLYLLTNPHTNLCGMYSVSIRYIAFETGLTVDQVKKALSKFEQDNKALYRNDWIVLINYQKHQTASPKIKAGIKREMSEIPLEIANLRYGIDRVSIGIDKPVPELELKLKEKIYKKEIEKDFETFWKAYPKRVARKKALEVFEKLDQSLLPEILSALEKQKCSASWKDIKFIPHPTTWLNQARWEDEPEPIDLRAERERLGDVRFFEKYGEQALLKII